MTTLLRLPSVLERTGLSRSKLYELIADGKFVKPIKHSPRVNCWPSNLVQDWIDQRIAESVKAD